jgi:hypothetical protein
MFPTARAGDFRPGPTLAARPWRKIAYCPQPALALTLLGVGMRAVPDYRAFVIGPDDHVIDRHDLTANDDEAAKKRVQELAELAEGYDIELWHLDRKIARFKAKHPPRPR